MSVPPDHAGAMTLPAAPAESVLPTGSDADGEHAAFEHVDRYLQIGLESGASDIHLSVNMPPIWRRNGSLEPMFRSAPRLTVEEMKRLTYGCIDEVHLPRLEEQGDVDFAYSAPFGRFRASAVRQRLGLELVFRVLASKLRTMDELGLPPALKKLTEYHNGLVLVTGAVGSGKSTTLLSFIQQINLNRRDHIITLEDPIEALIESAGCQVTQREVHLHTRSFSAALRSALREDPDVLMVGEMRDLETISLAISASETGHLVLGTLHTGSAARTLDRLLDVFPVEQRDQIRTMVSDSLRGIISQQLVPRADGKGRVLALEVLINTPAVGAVIRDAKTFMLPGMMQTGRKQGMLLMDESLRTLVAKGLITAEEAYIRATDKQMMKTMLGI